MLFVRKQRDAVERLSLPPEGNLAQHFPVETLPRPTVGHAG